jgi:hypothetical protein
VGRRQRSSSPIACPPCAPSDFIYLFW